MNKGLQNATKNDERYTPRYAVEPLLKYVHKDKKIVLPFDTEGSYYYKVFKENDYNVECLHLENGQDFFLNMFDEYDLIISNPPFSIKDQILERLYLINKPFIMLLPLTTLQSGFRTKLFKKYGIDLIVFDKRIGFEVNGKLNNGNWFASAYFTYKVLDKQLIFEELNKWK